MSIVDGNGSQGPTVIGICIAFAILTFIVLVLRLFARIYVLRKMGLDDYLIVAACCLAWAFIAVTITAVGKGLGQHYKYVDKSELGGYLFDVWLSSIFYLACLGFVKTSVLCFYTRLGDLHLTRLSYIMIGVIVCQATAFVLVAAFQCQPIQMAWAQNGPKRCVDINVFYLCNAALNILTDILTYTLPIRVIFNLHMPSNQQIALLFILCLGLLYAFYSGLLLAFDWANKRYIYSACVSSIVRITYIPAMLTSADATYATSGAMYWSVIETNTAIFAASILSLKAIASYFVPRFTGEVSNSQKYHHKPGNAGGRYHYNSGFTKVTDTDNIPIGTINGPEHTRLETQIGATMAGSSSRERIIPEGKIFAQTEIETTFEMNSGYAPSSDNCTLEESL